MAFLAKGNQGSANRASRMLLIPVALMALSACDLSESKPNLLASLVPSVFKIEKVLYKSDDCFVTVFSVKAGPEAAVLISQRKTRVEMFSRQTRKDGDIRKHPEKTFSAYYFEPWQRTPIKNYADAIAERTTRLMTTVARTLNCLKKSDKYQKLLLKYVYRNNQAVFTTGRHYSLLILYIPKEKLLIVSPT